MRTFKNILVYVDTNSTVPQMALDSAIELALANNARLKIVDVLPELPWYARTSMSDIQELRKAVEAKRKKILDTMAASAKQAGINVHVRVLTGKPFIAIIQEVIRAEHDLVVKTAMGSGELNDRILGNTGVRLLRKCPCPVWVVKPDRATNKKVLAAIDPDPDEPGKTMVARRVLELAREMTDWSGGELYVIHAWSVYGDHLMSTYRPEDFEAYVNGVEDRVQDHVQNFVMEHGSGIKSDQVFLLRGEPQTIIPNFISRENIDLVVLGTVGRTGMSGLLIGNTAEALVERVRCSMLAIKPEGFVSPVSIEA